MPEGPELHLTSLFINRVCRDLVFSGTVQRNPIHKCPDISWNHPSYTISAESRGKELKLFLQAVDEKRDRKCQSLNKRKGKVIGEDDQAATPSSSTSILFTFGMSGKFELTRANELLKHSHLTFLSQVDPSKGGQNGMALSFVDYRRFGKWYQNSGWSKDRGPCVIKEFNEFLHHVADNLDHNAFNRPLCEVMLDQRFFNGIGNYLRAEVLYRCKVAPFERAVSFLKAHEVKENGLEVKKTEMKNLNKKKNKGKKEAISTGMSSANEIAQSAAISAKSEAGINGGELEIKKEEDDTELKNENDITCINSENQFTYDQKNIKEEIKADTTTKSACDRLSTKGQELLHFCHSIALEVVKIGSTKNSLSEMYQDSEAGSYHDWLQCYYQDGMKNLADHNGRTIWFTGPAGPLVPKEQKSRSKKTHKKKAEDEVTPKVDDSTSKSKSSSQAPAKSSSKIAKKPLTRKHLKNLEVPILEKSEHTYCKRRGKQTKKYEKETCVGANAISTVSQRKRKAAKSPVESNLVKRQKEDPYNHSKQNRKRITRSSLQLTK